MESYFGQAYPYEKLDYIAIPESDPNHLYHQDDSIADSLGCPMPPQLPGQALV